MGSLKLDDSLNPILTVGDGDGDAIRRIAGRPISNPLENRVNELEREKGALERQLDTARSEVETLEGRVSSLQGQVSDEKARYDDLLARAREAVQAAYDKGVQDVIEYLRSQGIL